MAPRTIQWNTIHSRSRARWRLPQAAHGRSGSSANVSSAHTELAPKHAPRREPKLAPWFAAFFATSGATLGAHPTDEMLSHSPEFLPRPFAVTSPVNQPALGVDPALPTTVRITGRPGSTPGWEFPQLTGRGRN